MRDKILDHIANVRDWLDRAERDYKMGAFLQGELNLNLASAELKKTWEESRKLHFAEKVVELPLTSQRDNSYKRGGYKKLSTNTLRMTAAIVIIVMVGISSIFGMKYLSSGGIFLSSNQDDGILISSNSSMLPDTKYVEQPSEVNTALSNKSVSINFKPYEQTSFSIEMNSSEEVIETFEDYEVPTFDIDYKSLKLTSRGITPVNPENKKLLYTDNTITDKNISEKSRIKDYDLNKLIEMAQEVLYVRR